MSKPLGGREGVISYPIHGNEGGRGLKLFKSLHFAETVVVCQMMMLYERTCLTFRRRRPYVQLPGAENPFAKLSLEAQCRNCTLETINTMSISWSLREVVGGVSNKSPQSIVTNKTYDDSHWIPEPDLRSMTRAGINSEFLILRANSLKTGTPYAVRVEG